MEYRFGRMAVGFRDTGKITRLMDRVRFIIMMGMFMKERGGMIRFMGRESIPALMDIFTRENGVITRNKVKVTKPGRMEKIILESLRMVPSMEEVVSSSRTAVTMKGSSHATKLTEEVIFSLFRQIRMDK